ncbi:MAG: hypothetical protein ABI035_03290 [Gemmatimonadaceae bacterium]
MTSVNTVPPCVRAEAHAGGATAERRFALIVLAAFLLVTVPVMLRHELWRDEVQAWLLARDAASLSALFHLLHYEGHPSLWYLLLRPIAKVVRDPRWMQPIALLFSCGSVYVFARCAPFSRLIRALFAFGYFVVYGYTIVARSYGVGLCLAVLLCVLVTAPRRRYGLAAIVMALLANTSVYGSMLVVACVIGLASDAVLYARDSQRRKRIRRIALPVIVGLASVLLAALQVWPASDNPFVGPGLAGSSHPAQFRTASGPLLALAPIWRGYVPIPRMEQTSDIWWANFLVDRSHKGAILSGILSILGVAILAILVRRSLFALSFYLAGTCILILFSVFVYGGSLYHHGYFFLVAIMALWFAAAQAAARPNHSNALAHLRPVRWLDRHLQLAIVALLVLQVVGGGFRLVADYLLPFSEGEATADYIRSHGLADLLIVASPGFNATTVAGYLGRPIFALDRRAFMTFAPLSTRADIIDDSAVLARINVCCARRDSSTVLLLDHRLEAASPSLLIRPLVVLANALVPENFYVYEVRHR